MEVILANPRGFCAGVHRAIEIVERALEIYGAPVYVRHEVVHNRFVVDGLRSKGAIFIEDLSEVPDASTLVFSAHGVPRHVREEAESRGLTIFDATCPLVTKVHVEVTRYAKEGRETILIGHAGHPEVEGTLGQYDESNGGQIYLVESPEDVDNLVVHDTDNLAFVTQTTLSVDDARAVIDALVKRFPKIQGPKRDDICYATQNRQDAVRKIAHECDILLVVGSRNSSNSNRLRELGEKNGVTAYLIDGPQDLCREWFSDDCRVGLTAGASAPETLVQEVLERLKEWGVEDHTERAGREEHISFSLPYPLRS